PLARASDDGSHELVPEHAAEAEIAATQLEVGAADPRERDPHQRSVGAGGRLGPLDQRGAGAVEEERPHQGQPAPGTSTSTTSMRPARCARVSEATKLLAVHRKSVRRSGPPSMHAMACVATGMRCVTAPPSRTRSTVWLTGEATQMAPSASRQMPSGTARSSCAQTRRFESVPSAAASDALKREADHPPTTSVPAA